MDFIVYFLITDQSWDSELYGTITAIQKFTPVLLNPLWVALAEVASCVPSLLAEHPFPVPMMVPVLCRQNLPTSEGGRENLLLDPK